MGGNNLNSVGTVTASNVAGQNGNFGVSLVSIVFRSMVVRI
ncbi:hypothetical protein [Salmonella enterica]